MQLKRKALFIFGTRPEAIKLAPLIQTLQQDPDFESIVCVTAQHREMLDQVLTFFKIRTDFDLNLMTPNQELATLSARILLGLEDIFRQLKPDLVFIQGDTTTALMAGLGAFYHRIPVVHIEAGLRTGNLHSPFPEEANRRLLSTISQFHFCPTEETANNLKKELHSKIESENVFNVGNTVIDALLHGLSALEKDLKFQNDFKRHHQQIDFHKKIVLMTAHRRESFGEPIRNIFRAVKKFAEENSEYEVVYPVHPNPNIKIVAEEILGEQKNIHLIAPLSYPELIWLMNLAHFVITDSGGIQEEAPSLKKPVLVLRDSTERMEGVHVGTNKLVGTAYESVYKAMTSLAKDPQFYGSFAKVKNPFGDGNSCQYILRHLKKNL